MIFSQNLVLADANGCATPVASVNLSDKKFASTYFGTWGSPAYPDILPQARRLRPQWMPAHHGHALLAAAYPLRGSVETASMVRPRDRTSLKAGGVGE